MRPEVFSCSVGISANVCTAQIGDMFDSWLNECRMPKAKDDARGKLGFPLWNLHYTTVDEGKQTIRVVVGLAINIKLHMLVLGLKCIHKSNL